MRSIITKTLTSDIKINTEFLNNNSVCTESLARETTMAYRIFEALWGMIHLKNTEMTEEQQDEPDSPSTQLDLTPHDDSPYIVNDLNEVLKELRETIVGMEKRLQEVEKTCKNLCTERKKGEINTEVSLQCNSTNPQNSSPLLSTDNNDEGDDLSHAKR